MFGANQEDGGINQMSALLEQGCEFDGKLTFDGTVRINGQFTGEIFSEGTLVIGEGAVVEAKIEVRNIIINGKLRGEIAAEERIEMNSPAEVRGNISARTLVIEEGVLFEGSCQMGERSVDHAGNGKEKELQHTGHHRAIDEADGIESDLNVE